MRVLLILPALLNVFGCVSKTVFDEMADSRNYYKAEYRAADSVHIVNNTLFERNRNLEAELNNAELELNKAISTNRALYRNYDELLAEYNRLLISLNEAIEVTAYEKQNLTERIAVQQAELDRVRRNTVTGSVMNAQNVSPSPIPYETSRELSSFSALQVQWKKQLEVMTEIHNRLAQSIAGYGTSARVQIQKNRITLSIAHSLLFPQGGHKLDYDGFEILKSIGYILKSYDNLDILVVGRGDSYGDANTDLEYGIQRASTIAMFLNASGVDSTYASVHATKGIPSLSVQSVLDQSDIVITQKMDIIYQLLDR
jgi:outer membrane protein OmpA-like peptidoglycan-associated protein